MANWMSRQRIQETVMGADKRIFATFCLVAMLATPAPVEADRISVWRPLDIEQQRKSYENSGREFPEERLREQDEKARERHEALARQLAPVKPSIDRSGKLYFEGRILKVFPPIDRSAPRDNPNHWAKVVFEAYGRGGTPTSRKPAIVSMQWAIRNYAENKIDTVADYTRLLSNRHEIMNVEFGSPRHRQAIFTTLDPDGSMGLPGGAAEEASNDLKEGALMVFAKRGIPHDMARRKRYQINPIDPILLFNDGLRIDLPYLLIEEYARSRRYPAAYEPSYAKTAKAALQIFYTLSLATPDLTSLQYQGQARKNYAIGVSTYNVMSDMLNYEGPGYSGAMDPFLPVTGDDIRRTVLDVLADGPVVPSPLIKKSVGAVTLIWRLMEIIEKDQSLATLARKVLERHLAPEPGEEPGVTALYEFDREQNRQRAWETIRSGLGLDSESFHPATYTLARIGWGEGKETEEIVDDLLYFATLLHRDPAEAYPIDLRRVTQSIAALRLIALPEKYSRKDRVRFANAAAAELDRKIEEIRRHLESGFASTGESYFLEMWDAGDD